MNYARLAAAGWGLFLLTVGVFVGSGFQAPAEKTGVADINRLMEQSDFGKDLKDQLDRMRVAREGVLEFIDTNRVLTLDQAMKIRDLSLKMDATPAEKADLDVQKTQVILANKRWTELATKTKLSEEERTMLQDYADRAQKMNELGTRWVREFTNDIDRWLEKQKTESNRRARTAIQETAKAQGFTMVYDSVFAPYGANDITDASLQAMNAKK